MKNLFVFLARVAVLFGGLTLLICGYGFFLLDFPNPTAGWCLIGLGLPVIVWIIWPDRASDHPSATTNQRLSVEEEWEAAADGKVVRIASYRKKSGRPLARHLDGSRAWHGVGDSLCD